MTSPRFTVCLLKFKCFVFRFSQCFYPQRPAIRERTASLQDIKHVGCIRPSYDNLLAREKALTRDPFAFRMASYFSVRSFEVLCELAGNL